MIDLTPLDVRKKRGDFAKGLRGYDVQEVDTFLELVAERMEELVKENLRLTDRSELLQLQVDASEGREKAVQEALVTAQELRADVAKQAEREADLTQLQARTEIEKIVAEAEGRLMERKTALEELERQRLRFLKAFRMLLEREMDVVEVEDSREPLEQLTVDLDLGGMLSRRAELAAEEGSAPEAVLDGVATEVEEDREAEEDLEADEGWDDVSEEEGEPELGAVDDSDYETGTDDYEEDEESGSDEEDQVEVEDAAAGANKAPLWLYEIDDSEDRG